MFRSDVSSKFLYFVGKVSDEDWDGKTMVNAWKYFGGCLFNCVLTIWCSSLLENARAILSMYN